MKITKITNNEIVVFLNEMDLELFDITPESMGTKSASLHKFLFALMETVSTETGFNPYDGQVVVEASPYDGGIKLSITKVSNRSDEEDKSIDTSKLIKKFMSERENTEHIRTIRGRKITRDELRRSSAVRVVKKRNVDKGMSERKTQRPDSVCLFSTYENLEDALVMIDKHDFSDCELYRGKKEYALIIPGSRWNELRNYICEFADRYSRSYVLAADIREGWKKVVKGEKLAEMANALRAMR